MHWGAITIMFCTQIKQTVYTYGSTRLLANSGVKMVLSLASEETTQGRQPDETHMSLEVSQRKTRHLEDPPEEKDG